MDVSILQVKLPLKLRRWCWAATVENFPIVVEIQVSVVPAPKHFSSCDLVPHRRCLPPAHILVFLRIISVQLGVWPMEKDGPPSVVGAGEFVWQKILWGLKNYSTNNFPKKVMKTNSVDELSRRQHAYVISVPYENECSEGAVCMCHVEPQGCLVQHAAQTTQKAELL